MAFLEVTVKVLPKLRLDSPDLKGWASNLRRGLRFVRSLQRSADRHHTKEGLTDTEGGGT